MKHHLRIYAVGSRLDISCQLGGSVGERHHLQVKRAVDGIDVEIGLVIALGRNRYGRCHKRDTGTRLLIEVITYIPSQNRVDLSSDCHYEFVVGGFKHESRCLDAARLLGLGGLKNLFYFGIRLAEQDASLARRQGVLSGYALCAKQ